jgi:hypothetical protein
MAEKTTRLFIMDTIITILLVIAVYVVYPYLQNKIYRRH